MRKWLYETIFEADTRAGRWFDLLLLGLIVLSVVALMLESVPEIARDHGARLRVIEWTLTGLFTFEYVLRLYCVDRPLRYATSFFGLVDLMAIVPTYLSVFLPHSQSLAIVRILRLVRVFRVLKLVRFLGEAEVLLHALRGSTHKIIVFLVVVTNLVVVAGTAMYFVEGATNPGFRSIPHGVYWAIVTVTTVGFGDITPETGLGRVLTSILIIAGYGIIAVPTGIVTSELVRPRNQSTQVCPNCLSEGHAVDAIYCRRCSSELNPD